MLLQILLVLSCTPEPTWWSCETAACRESGAVDAYHESPTRFSETLGGLDEPEQLALIRQLSEAGTPSEMLCASQNDPAALSRLCERLTQRPHLSIVPKPIKAKHRSATGPVSDLLPVPPVPPRTAPGCKEFNSTARMECLFKAAETTMQTRGTEGLDDAVGFCVAADEFASGCMHHVVAHALPDVPPSDTFGRGDIEYGRTIVTALAKAVGGDLDGLYGDYFWALWTWNSMRQAQVVTGELLDVLPEARAQIHYAAAKAILSRERDVDTLETLARELDLQLAIRKPLREGVTGGPPSTLKKESKDFWHTDHGKIEAAIPATWCAGPSRRATSEDPSLDRKLAIIDAAGRVERHLAPPFFLEILASEDHIWLRWTALRVLAGLHPETLSQVPHLAKSEPLMSARLAWSKQHHQQRSSNKPAPKK